MWFKPHFVWFWWDCRDNRRWHEACKHSKLVFTLISLSVHKFAVIQLNWRHFKCSIESTRWVVQQQQQQQRRPEQNNIRWLDHSVNNLYIEWKRRVRVREKNHFCDKIRTWIENRSQIGWMFRSQTKTKTFDSIVKGDEKDFKQKLPNPSTWK